MECSIRQCAIMTSSVTDHPRGNLTRVNKSSKGVSKGDVNTVSVTNSSSWKHMAADVTLENVADVLSTSLSFCTVHYVVETPSVFDSDDHHLLMTTCDFPPACLIGQCKGENYLPQQNISFDYVVISLSRFTHCEPA